MKGRVLSKMSLGMPIKSRLGLTASSPKGMRDRLLELGPPRQIAQWMKGQPLVSLRDTTMSDAHLSLFATTLCTTDMVQLHKLAHHVVRVIGVTHGVGRAQELLKQDVGRTHSQIYQALTRLSARKSSFKRIFLMEKCRQSACSRGCFKGIFFQSLSPQRGVVR